jgi:hypothetical protein
MEIGTDILPPSQEQMATVAPGAGGIALGGYEAPQLTAAGNVEDTTFGACFGDPEQGDSKPFG